MAMNIDKNSSKKGKAFWGPPTWFMLHFLAAILRPGTSHAYKTLLSCLTKILPCKECRGNLELKLEILPPDRYLKNNEDAFLYSYTIHDMANQQISVVHPETPKNSPNYDKIREFYFKGGKEDGKKDDKENILFWEDHFWFVIHMLATTLQPEYAKEYKKFLVSIVQLIPSEKLRNVLESSMKTIPPDAYLSNNHDAFFYSYVLRDIANSKLHNPKSSQNYDDMKSYYFTALFQECKECSV